MSTSRAYRWLLPAIAALGLTSCDRLPGQPVIGITQPTQTGPISESTLAANRARWSASHINSYRYRFRWECFCVTDFIRVVDITVVNGTIVSVVDAETRALLDPQSAARYRTIEGLFDFIQEAIDYPAVSIEGSFDSRFGYPSTTYSDYVAGLADEEMGFRVYGLTPFRRQ